MRRAIATNAPGRALATKACSGGLRPKCAQLEQNAAQGVCCMSRPAKWWKKKHQHREEARDEMRADNLRLNQKDSLYAA